MNGDYGFLHNLFVIHFLMAHRFGAYSEVSFRQIWAALGGSQESRHAACVPTIYHRGLDGDHYWVSVLPSWASELLAQYG